MKHTEVKLEPGQGFLCLYIMMIKPLFVCFITNDMFVTYNDIHLCKSTGVPNKVDSKYYFFINV